MTILGKPALDRADGLAARGIPDATVARLPAYLRALTAFRDRGVLTCSSNQLAETVGVNPAKLRRDLSYLGSYGTRGVGYEVDFLCIQIAREIGQVHDWNVAIVGVGHLGTALSAYQGFRSRGIQVVALIDNDSTRVGQRVSNIEVSPIEELAAVVSERDISIGVIATPGDAAQSVADQLIASGVTSILNFAPALVQVPKRSHSPIEVRQVDLSSELQILAYHQQRKVGTTQEVAQ